MNWCKFHECDPRHCGGPHCVHCGGKDCWPCPPCGSTEADHGDDYYATHLRGPGGVSDEIALGWDRPEPDDITCASTDEEAGQ